MPKEFSVTGVNNDGVEEIRLSSRTHRGSYGRGGRLMTGAERLAATVLDVLDYPRVVFANVKEETGV